MEEFICGHKEITDLREDHFIINTLHNENTSLEYFLGTFNAPPRSRNFLPEYVQSWPKKEKKKPEAHAHFSPETRKSLCPLLKPTKQEFCITDLDVNANYTTVH